MFNTLALYLNYPFVRYALIVGILISLCSSLLGIILVLKRFSHIGDGLSHVAFGAMALASFLNLSKQKMIIALPLTILLAIFLLKNNHKSKINGDSKIAMLSVASLAIGYLLMNLSKTSSNISADVCTTLFGSTSILTLNKEEVYLSIILSIIVVMIFIFLYNRIFTLTFDEDFAKATGLNTDKYNLLIAIIIAIIIVLSMNLVGSLLISALVIFPTISAMQIFDSFKYVTIFSSIIAVICSLFGIIISILIGTPVGSTIVVANIIIFIIVYLWKRK